MYRYKILGQEAPYPEDKEHPVGSYLESLGLSSSPSHLELAWLAYNLVNAEFALSDTSQTLGLQREGKIDAMLMEIAGWQQKADRYLGSVPDRRGTFERMVDDLRNQAAQTRQPTAEDRAFTQLGIAGRMGDAIIEEPMPVTYAWQNPENVWESGFNRAPKDR